MSGEKFKKKSYLLSDGWMKEITTENYSMIKKKKKRHHGDEMLLNDTEFAYHIKVPVFFHRLEN
jgi:hypothetical protein